MGTTAAKPSKSIFRYANPMAFQRIADPVLPWLWAVAVLTIGVGLYWGLFASPKDYQQGHSVRIMYIHVPSAWMCMFCYTVLAASSFMSFVFRHPLADVSAKAIAPIGAAFTLAALVTGALWGKPTWGTYWVWDARLTSVLILFFLYLGYMAVWQAMEDQTRAARAASILAMVGFVNIPIIKFSVDWWNTLHQPASITDFKKPAIDGSMLWPLLIMGVGFLVLVTALHLVRMKTEIAERRAQRLMQGTGTAASVSVEPAPELAKAEGGA